MRIMDGKCDPREKLLLPAGLKEEQIRVGLNRDGNSNEVYS